MVNRTQALVLGFVALAWAAAMVILAVAPDVYDRTLNAPPAYRRSVDLAFAAALTLFLSVLGIGVVRRWRWMFWLVLVAFLSGVLRLPAYLLQLAGVVSATGPGWYGALQAAIGAVQFVIGLAMLAGYRRGGTWGSF